MTLTNYWWLLIWLFIGGLFLNSLFSKRDEIVLGKREKRWDIIPAVILVLPYIIWAAYRSDNWGDTGSYRTMFSEAPTAISSWGSYLNDVTKDKGFSVLVLLIKLVNKNSDVIFFLILAIIQMICIVVVYRKYSNNYWLSIFLFIATTDYMSWMHNGIRQFTAVTLIFAATTLILQKKYIPLVLIIILASTIHGSALLMIPIIFISRGEPWNKKTLLFILASVAALAFVGQFTNILDSLLADTQYTNVVSDWQSWNDDGTNPVRVLVYSIPTILSFVGLKRIKEENDPMINFAVNASIVSTAIYIVSMGTSGIFIGRLPIYVSLYSTGILLPWEIDNMFTDSSARLIKICTILFFSAFFWYQMHAWGML
ncbi:EpsG family protein [Anaerostipes butyraticus]|uniref:EpsG family protein n=1 Tax=Anaerostipes butyraticus TaxID=645466 RepID=UPI00320A225E